MLPGVHVFLELLYSVIQVIKCLLKPIWHDFSLGHASLYHRKQKCIFEVHFRKQNAKTYEQIKEGTD